MLNPKILSTVFILSSFLGAEVFADTTSTRLSATLYQDINIHQQHNHDSSFHNRSLINTQAKAVKVKLGMVFTPEDLVIITNKNAHINYFQDQLATVEGSSNNIIGFYIKSFF